MAKKSHYTFRQTTKLRILRYYAPNANIIYMIRESDIRHTFVFSNCIVLQNIYDSVSIKAAFLFQKKMCIISHTNEKYLLLTHNN